MEKSVESFECWATLFTGKLFVVIVAYADESGTHDQSGQQPGAAIATIGGYIGDSVAWGLFSENWKLVLERYKMTSFHFADWTSAGKSLKSGGDYVAKPGHYYGWKVRQLYRFIGELGAVVAEHKVFPFGGWVDADKIHNAKAVGGVPEGLDSYGGCLSYCFGQISDMMLKYWPTDKANVVFDRMDAGSWRTKVLDQFDLEKSKNPHRLGAFSFADDQDAAGAGIQAADLIVGYIRQESLRQRDGRIKNQEPWEKAICKGRRFNLPVDS